MIWNYWKQIYCWLWDNTLALRKMGSFGETPSVIQVTSFSSRLSRKRRPLSETDVFMPILPCCRYVWCACACCHLGEPIWAQWWIMNLSFHMVHAWRLNRDFTCRQHFHSQKHHIIARMVVRPASLLVFKHQMHFSISPSSFMIPFNLTSLFLFFTVYTKPTQARFLQRGLPDQSSSQVSLPSQDSWILTLIFPIVILYAMKTFTLLSLIATRMWIALLLLGMLVLAPWVDCRIFNRSLYYPSLVSTTIGAVWWV